MNIGVLASENSWHFQDLKRAAGSQHRIISIAFDDLVSSFGYPETALVCGSINLLSLDRLIVRTMPPGSLQQVVFRMDFLHHLQNAGVEIINSPRTIEISVDKYRSLNLIVDAGVPIPQTRVAESLSSALACFDALGRDVVYKPIFGSMGRGIRRLTHHSSARTFFETQIGEGQIIYLQTFIDHGDWDIRILILGDQTFAIRRHRKGHWLTNLSQGAIATPHQASDQELAVAFAAAQAIDCQVAGVDLFYDTQTGRLMVCDVNAAPGWKGTAAALGVDLGAAMLEFICGTDKPNQSN